MFISLFIVSGTCRKLKGPVVLVRGDLGFVNYLQVFVYCYIGGGVDVFLVPAAARAGVSGSKLQEAAFDPI